MIIKKLAAVAILSGAGIWFAGDEPQASQYTPCPKTEVVIDGKPYVWWQGYAWVLSFRAVGFEDLPRCKTVTFSNGDKQIVLEADSLTGGRHGA